MNNTGSDPLDAYTEVKVLGSGAFGTAKLVKLKTGGRREPYRVIKEVDLKSLSAAVAEESHKEVGVLRQLSHRHIIAYFDTFVKTSVLYIVMEYADAGDLARAIKKRKEEDTNYTETEAMTIFGQCLLALQYIHKKKILHRDIKSQNIFMMEVGDAKIGDFGISKVLESTTAEARSLIGTPSYFPPEICEDKPYNGKVDVWSMGVVLYELLALTQPFVASNVAALVMKIVNTEPPPLPESTRPEACDVVRLALQKNPEDRASAEELLQLPAVSCRVSQEEDFGNATGTDQFIEMKQLGRGAHGVAMLVKSKPGSFTGFRVVKTVELNRLSDTARKGAKEEVAVLRRLAHPHIIAYFDAFVEAEQLHIVLEYADGGDLFSAVKERREEESFFSDEEAMGLFHQCLLALYYIHSKKVLHRDIKTQNIFLMKTGDAKLGDFGISKVMEDTFSEAATVVGTPAYLAPEICESMPYGNKIDVWSLGTVLYEVLALRQPFASSNMAATIMKIIGKDPDPLPSRVSDEVRNVVQLALQKKPDDRPTAKELLRNPAVQRFSGDAAEEELNLTQTSDSSWGGSKPIEGDEAGTLQAGVTALLANELAEASQSMTAEKSLKGLLEDELQSSVDSIDGLPKSATRADLGTTALSTTLALSGDDEPQDETQQQTVALTGTLKLDRDRSGPIDGDAEEDREETSGVGLGTLLLEASLTGKSEFVKTTPMEKPVEGWNVEEQEEEEEDDSHTLSGLHKIKGAKDEKVQEKVRRAKEQEEAMKEEMRLWKLQMEEEAQAAEAAQRTVKDVEEEKMAEKVRKAKEQEADRREEMRLWKLQMEQEAQAPNDVSAPSGRLSPGGDRARSSKGTTRRSRRELDEDPSDGRINGTEGLQGSASQTRPRQDDDEVQKLLYQEAANQARREAAEAREKTRRQHHHTARVVGSDAIHDAIDAHMHLASSQQESAYGTMLRSSAALASPSASPRPIRGAGSSVVGGQSQRPSSDTSGHATAGLGVVRPSSSSSSSGRDKAAAFWRSQGSAGEAEQEGTSLLSPQAGPPRRHVPSSPSRHGATPTGAPLRPAGSGTGMHDAVLMREKSAWIKPS